jgi:hypothetical protein
MFWEVIVGEARQKKSTTAFKATKQWWFLKHLSRLRLDARSHDHSAN